MTDTLTLEWIRQSPQFNTANDEYAPSVVTDASNNIIVAYTTNSAGGIPPNNGVVAKFDPAGNLLWKNTDISDTIPPISIAYCITSDTLYATYLNADTGNIHVVKVSAAGQTLWNVTPTGIINGPGSNNFPSISVDISENIYIAYEAGFPANVYVAQISAITGQDLWIDHDLSMNIPARNNLRPSILMTNTQYAYICFYYVGPVGPLRDVVVAKYDVTAPLSNKLVWKVQGLSIDTSGNDLFPNITHDSVGNLYGVYRFGNNPIYAINSFKLDPSGNVLWANKNMATSTKIEPSIIITKNNELFVFYIDNLKLVVQELDPITGVTLWTDTRTDLNPVAGSMAIAENFYVCRNCTTDDEGAVIVTYSISGDAVAGGTNSGFYDLVVAKFKTPLTGLGTFPVHVGSGIYRTTGRVNVYTDEVITALRAGEDLPPTTTVDFSPLTAGRILRSLGRGVTIPGLYRFIQMQLIGGPSTEGVGGSASTWNSGWICTWAAAGTPPTL